MKYIPKYALNLIKRMLAEEALFVPQTMYTTKFTICTEAQFLACNKPVLNL